MLVSPGDERLEHLLGRQSDLAGHRLGGEVLRVHLVFAQGERDAQAFQEPDRVGLGGAPHDDSPLAHMLAGTASVLVSPGGPGYDTHNPGPPEALHHPGPRPMTTPEPTTPQVASTAEIRAHFPALGRRVDGQAVAYFDGPGGTQVPRGVAEAMTDYLYNHNANTHWAFPTSHETDQALANARQALADFLNASPREVAFGANMSTLTFHLSRALGRGFAAGDAIVVTELDHHANVDPWRDMARERGLTVRVVRMDPKTGQLDRDDLRRQMSGRPKLLAIGAASNALGTINDVAEAARLAHDAGALLFVDAVHYAPHRLVDVRAIDCDFLACSAYKFYGPHVGVLYGKHDLLERLDVPKLRPAPDTAPERLETGTQNHEGIVGAAAAVDFLAGLADGPTRRDRLRAAFDVLHERGDGAGRAALAGAERDRWGAPLRASALGTAHADRFVYGRRAPFRGSLPPPGRPGDLRFSRRLLCHDGGRAPGPVRTRAGPDRLRLLHHRGRDRPTPRGGAGDRFVSFRRDNIGARRGGLYQWAMPWQTCVRRPSNAMPAESQ